MVIVLLLLCSMLSTALPVLADSAVPAGAGENYVLIAEWGGEGSGAGEFQNPYGIAVDADGNVYAADRDNHRVQKFDNDGNFIDAWGWYGYAAGQLRFANGVAIDPDGYVYVTDRDNHRVQKFTPDGEYVLAWGTQIDFAAVDNETDLEGLFGGGEFYQPSHIAADADGSLVVMDLYRLQRFSPSGAFIEEIGSYNGIDVSFAVDPSGAGDEWVWLSDLGYGGDARHVVFNLDADFEIEYAWGSDASPLNFYPDATLAPGKFSSGEGGPRGIAVDGAGAVYVSDTLGGRIQKFTNDGVFLTQWGLSGSLEQPRDLTVDSAGNVFVVDSNKIKKFMVTDGEPAIDNETGSGEDDVSGNGGGGVGSDNGTSTPGLSSCTCSVAPLSMVFEAAGGSGIITVDASGDSCEWWVDTSADWIGIDGSSTGIGDDKVTITVAPSDVPYIRIGSLTVRDVTVTIRQAAADIQDAECPATLLLESESVLQSLRRTRDSLLVKTTVGVALVRGYYAAAGDAVRLLRRVGRYVLNIEYRPGNNECRR